MTFDVSGDSVPESPLKGDLLILVSMALFGTYALFLRLFPTIPTLAFLLAFQIVGAIGCIFLGAFRKSSMPADKSLLLLLALAAVACGNDLCYFFAFRMTSVANAAIAHQTVSGFLLIMAPTLLSEHTKRSEWIAMLCALGGIVALYSDGTQFGGFSDITGVTLGLLSAFFYALLIVLYKILADRKLSLVQINSWRYCLSTVLLLPTMFIWGNWQIQPTDIGVLIGFGFLFAILASFMHNYGMIRTRALHVSILGKSEPVFAALYAALLLSEPITMQTLIGGALILGSGVWLAFNSRTATTA